MLVALALCTVLTAAEGDEPLEAPPPPVTPPEATLKPLPTVRDALKPAPTELPPETQPPLDPLTKDQHDEESRVRRIGLTLAGGAAGVALPMLLGWGADKSQPCSPGFFVTCDGFVSGFATFVPLTVGLGIGLPHYFLGGRAGAGFGLAGALAGYMTAACALGFVSLGGQEWAKRAPIAGAGLMTGLGLLGAVGALELRHDALEYGNAKEWPLGRMFAEGAVFWLPAGLVETALVVGTVAATYGNWWDGGTISAVVITLGTVANLTLASLAGWGVHRALGGTGKWWAALVGALASSSIATGFVALHGHAPPQGGIFRGGTLSMIPVLTIGSVIAATGPAVALEWTSDDPKQRMNEEDDIRLDASVINGGGVIGLSGRF